MATFKPADETANNLLAAGALYALLSQVPRENEFYVEVVMIDGVATGELRVEFPFLNSPYVVTITREADAEAAADV